MKQYRVTCLLCKKSDVVSIVEDDHQIMNFKDGAMSNLLAARWRQSGDWGWQCSCGNDNRISKSEESFMSVLVTGDKMSIEKIKASLKLDDVKQFAMEVV